MIATIDINFSSIILYYIILYYIYHDLIVMTVISEHNITNILTF
jgi:hypothetical protein